jgi:hypothetical protein
MGLNSASTKRQTASPVLAVQFVCLTRNEWQPRLCNVSDKSMAHKETIGKVKSISSPTRKSSKGCLSFRDLGKIATDESQPAPQFGVAAGRRTPPTACAFPPKTLCRHPVSLQKSDFGVSHL